MITSYTDEYDLPRRTMNLKVACNAPPDSDLRMIANAYVGSPDSGYSIVYWSLPSEVKRSTSSSVQINDHIIEKHGSAWKVVSSPPSLGSSGEIVSICGDNPTRWDATRWSPTLTDLLHGGFVYASGWTTWRNITGPLNKQELSRIMQHSKLSRPGPSYWKVAFLQLLLKWTQETHWDFIDTQRASGIIAAAAKMAE